MIDRKHKLILVHLPKTGGTSGARALGSRKDEDFKGKHWRLKNYSRAIADFNTYHTFGFVRNPWARMAAWYRFKAKRNRTGGLEFGEWLKLPRVHGLPRKEEDFFFLNGKFALDSVGRFENLEQDFKRIVFPFMGDIVFPHRFSLGPKNNYALYYNQQSIDLVEKRHQWLIKKFGYRFDDLLATD